MARSRVYRRIVVRCRLRRRCPDCGSNRMRKDGFANDKQAYKLRRL